MIWGAQAKRGQNHGPGSLFFMVYDNGFLVCTVVSLSPTRRDGAQTQEYTSLQAVSDEEEETHVLPVLCEDVVKAIGSVRN